MYLAQDLTTGNAEQEGTEAIEIIKLPLEKAVEMVMKSEITHGASCAALLKIKNLLKK